MKADSRPARRAELLLDSLVMFVFAAVLVWPLFKTRYLDMWGSIESTFIADARFLIAHWPHPLWQPLWYVGTRFDYIYPPALRYGTALVSMLIGYAPSKAYHVYTALLYCIGIAGAYLLIRAVTGSRGCAYLGASATALLSPSILFLPDIRRDTLMLEPQGLHVLIKYGEGPHISALALLPFALFFSWQAFETRRPTAITLAALFSAAVVSHNFYGATALTIFYLILLWSIWITHQNARIIVPAIAIPLLAYGLTAFWLVPSYLRITTENMRWVAKPGNSWSIWVALGLAILFALATARLARGRRERAGPVFATGAVLFFSLLVIGGVHFNVRISGEPHRLVPELDLAFILGALVLLRWLWNQGGPVPRAAAAILALAAFVPSISYLPKAWAMFPRYNDHTDRVEYKISEWAWKTMPDARLFPVGSVRIWFDAWHDLAQLGGGSDQGLLNSVTQYAQWEITHGTDPQVAVLWLQAMGVDAVYVSDQRSQEIYKDFQNPQKFVGVLPALYDDLHGNVIYQVARRFPQRVRVVDTARLKAVSPASNGGSENLRAYAGVVEHGPDARATLTRDGTDAMRVNATLAAGQSIVVQESYDPSWQAWSAGNRLAVHPDAMGLLAIDAPPGEHEVTLLFVTPLENKVGRMITGITFLAILGMFLRRRSRAS